jgi:hypothetical protein
MFDTDAWIINKIAQPSAVFLRDRLGINHWKFALECLHGAAIGVTVTDVHEAMTTKTGWEYLDWCMLAITLAWIFLYDRPLLIQWSNSANGPLNARIRQFLPRSWFFGVLLAQIILLPLHFDRWHIANLITIFLLVSSFYLRTVVMPPPKEKEQRFTVRANAS